MKDSLSIYPTFWLLFLRFGGAVLLFAACFYRRVAQLTRRDLVGGLAIGVYLFLGMGIQTLGLNYTTAGKQAFLTATYVILVPFLAWGLRRIFPGWLAILGALVCFFGMGLLTSDISGPLNRGDVLTVLSAVFFAAQILATEHYAAKSDPLLLTFVQLVVAAVLSLCVARVYEGPFVSRGWEGVGAIAYASAICTFLCLLIQNIGQKYTSASHASILLGLESVFGALSGVVLLHEVFTLRMSAGCFLIFGAVLLVELGPLFVHRAAHASLREHS
jgi:drug/metabolite transporter (DMT)-like permease